MKILFDHQTFTKQDFGGISRYFYELIKRFEGSENQCEVSILLSNNAYLNDNTKKGVTSFFPRNQFKGKSKIMHYVNEQKSKREISSGLFDIFHPTYYDDYYLNRLKNKPFVVTFLDMIHEKFEKSFVEMKDADLFKRKKILLERSARVIAISESTKNDIMEIFGTSGDKIQVIHLGNSLANTSLDEEPIISKPYILFVGNRANYKNFLTLIEIMPDIIKQNDIKLVCAGGGNFTYEENQRLMSLGISNRVVYQSFNNDKMLSNLYTNAMCFVFPSLYEGFGIPVLEAFACNCPCLLSTGGSLPEVGGNAAMYFNPNDKEELKKALNLILGNKERREELRVAGRLRLRQFSWDKTYQETIALYKQLL